MITTSNKIPYSYLRRVIVLSVTTLLLALFSLTLKAQTDNKNAIDRKNSKSIYADTSKPVDHIEIQGETGKGDTAIVYFKNGSKEKYLLNNADENKLFKRKYGALLPHPSNLPGEQKHGKHKDDSVLMRYEPLNPIPENISEITYGSETIWLKLKNGTKEQYDLRNEGEKENFESKYGKLRMKERIKK
jgi:hypothetical protein